MEDFGWGSALDSWKLPLLFNGKNDGMVAMEVSYGGWASEIRETTNLGWLKPYSGINHRFQLVIRISQPSTVGHGGTPNHPSYERP